MDNEHEPKIGFFWRLKNSLYVVLALFDLSFLSFFYIGYKSKSVKWLFYSFLYLLSYFIYLIPNAQTLGKTFIVLIYSLIYAFGIIHVFITRKEYLVRLEAAILLGIDEEKKFRDKVYQKYSANTQQPFQMNEEINAKILSDNVNVQKINEYIGKISKLEVRKQLEEIGIICGKAFEYVKQHPESENKIKPLVNYYLPELLKQMEKYIELSKNVYLNLSNVRTSMLQIEGVLPIFNNAVKNIYNQLFSDSLLDISNDIEVLKLHLEQNNLVDLA